MNEELGRAIIMAIFAILSQIVTIAILAGLGYLMKPPLKWFIDNHTVLASILFFGFLAFIPVRYFYLRFRSRPSSPKRILTFLSEARRAGEHQAPRKR